MGKVASFWPEGQNIVRTNCAVDKGKGRTGHGICSVGQPERFEIAMADEGASSSLLQRRHSRGDVAVEQQGVEKGKRTRNDKKRVRVAEVVQFADDLEFGFEFQRLFRKQDLLRSDWGSCQNRDAGEAAPSNGNDIPRRVTASVESIGGLEKRFSTCQVQVKTGV